MLTEKYKAVIDTARALGIKDLQATEAGGKIKLAGTATYQYDKDQLWDKIKAVGGWDKEVSADFKVERNDPYGFYTVQSGDTLSKLAKGHLGDAKRYMEIFNINKDVLTNPDLIKVGQKLKLPPK